MNIEPEPKLHLRDYRPRPRLFTGRTVVKKPRFPAIDAHNHLGEGIYALASIEGELLAGKRDAEPSQVRERLDEAMLANPVYWQKYYQGDAQALHLARKYSFSDRSRYYWPVPEVQIALSRLLQNLGDRPLPLTLLSQYLPVQYARIRDGEIANEPRTILLDKVRRVLSDYSYACGYPTGPV